MRAGVISLPTQLALGAAVLRSLLRSDVVTLVTARAWLTERAAEVSGEPAWLAPVLEAATPPALVRALGQVPGVGDIELEAMGPPLVRALREAIDEAITPHLAFVLTTQPYLLVHPQYRAAARTLEPLHALAEQHLPPDTRTLEAPTPEQLAALGDQVRALLDGVLDQPAWNEDEDVARSPYDDE